MKKLKLVSFVIFCISLAASLIFWFTQVRKGDRIGHYNGSAGIDSRAQCYR